MNIKKVLQRSWQMLWNYPALWLFGAVLALVGANIIYPGPTFVNENTDEWIKIKLTDSAMIQLPGADMTIDLTAPDGVRVVIPDSVSWSEFRDLVEELNLEESINLWPILIEFAVILVCALVVGTVTRYIAETSLIRMVDEKDATGTPISLREGFRRGLSIRTWRLFILDLAAGLLGVLAFIVVLGLIAVPILLAIGRSESVLVTAGIGTIGLFILAAYLWLAGSTVLSLVMQTIRRVCVIEGQSVPASIRQGVKLTKNHFKDFGLIWALWIGFRLLWLPIGGLMILLLAPLLLLTTLAGVAVSGVPAVLVAVISGMFTSEITSWIMGALAGLPIFIFVVISPILFVNGLLEVYLSSIWTLAYRELRELESTMRAPAPTVGTTVPKPGPAGLEIS